MQNWRPRSFSFWILLCLMLSHTQVPAQSTSDRLLATLDVQATMDDSSRDVHTRCSWTVGSDAFMVLRSIGNTLSTPLHWDSGDMIMAGGFFLAVSGSVLLDDEVRTVMLKNKTTLNDKLERVGYSYGAPQYAGPGAIAVYLSGLITDNQWLRETGIMLTETIVTVGIIQIPLKIIVGRARPETNEGNNSFHLLNGIAQENSSFFSGHAAIAFGFSTVLARQIQHPIATVALYSLAALTPLGRMYKDRHWFSDALIGTALGIFLGNTIVSWHNLQNPTTSSFHIIPTPNGVIVSLRY